MQYILEHRHQNDDVYFKQYYYNCDVERNTADSETAIQRVMLETKQSRFRCVMALRRHENAEDAIFDLSPHNWDDSSDACHFYVYQKEGMNSRDWLKVFLGGWIKQI